MAITSLSFLLFVFVTLIVYYVLPKNKQWIVLLLASVVFYLLSSLKGALFVLLTASTVYLSTIWMQAISDEKKKFLREHKNDLSREEKNEYKLKSNKKRKTILIATLFLNVGVLCFFKYFHFAIDNVNALLSVFGFVQINDTFSFIVPLGISFYTFQAIGYLADVYWEYYKAEKNYFKTLLFVSFFPQMTQGPISDFEQLSVELFGEHSFSYENFSKGFQRMMWGFMKKMVIANSFAPWVKDVFANYSNYYGITVLTGIFMYSIWIYADFSGYMDIMCGLCEMFGIRLSENFERPYFSKNIAEYWRRWHMTMGAWFKKYIYFPIAMAKWNRKLSKNVNKLGKHFSEILPATIALLVTWTATGLWHGASWAYITWGLVNGLFLILSLWLDPIYSLVKRKLNINDGSFLWRLFQVARTYIIVSFIKVLPEVGSLSDGWGLIKNVFIGSFFPSTLSDLFPFLGGYISFRVLVVVLFVGVWIFTSFLQRKKPIRWYFSKFPLWLRLLSLILIFFVIVIIGIPASMESVFLYEGF